MASHFCKPVYLSIPLDILPIPIVTSILDVAVAQDPAKRDLFETHFTQNHAIRAQSMRGHWVYSTTDLLSHTSVSWSSARAATRTAPVSSARYEH